VSKPESIGTIVTILVEADRETDVAVAERHGLGRNTISTWRARAIDDADLAKALAVARRRAHGAWRDAAAETYITIAQSIRDKVRANEEIPFSLIAAAKTYGSNNLQAGMLFGDGEAAGDDDEK
jgi:acyl-CoA reductase-like NAD-dependent aldehyde dehydrogenase